VIPAVGQAPDSMFLSSRGISLGRRGTIETDPVTFATNVEGVFAGGDAQSGPWIAIGAVAQGREAAISISRYLRGEDMREGREGPEVSRENFLPIPKGVGPRPRERMPLLDMAQRKAGFDEVEQGFTEEQAKSEASRCLNCMACCECFQCVSACKAQAVDHGMKEETVTLDVGAVILAPGFAPFDPTGIRTWGYGLIPNVITSMELERLLSASGPTQGHLVRPSDHKGVTRMAFLQCVGSRDLNKASNGYCSSVCCTYAVKEAMIARDHVKDLDVSVYFMDMRTHGKEFERYYERARDLGIRFVRCRVHSLEPVPGSNNVYFRYIDHQGKQVEDEVDLVVLSVGLCTPAGASDLAERVGIRLNPNGFAETSSFNPIETTRPGIFACGPLWGPRTSPRPSWRHPPLRRRPAGPWHRHATASPGPGNILRSGVLGAKRRESGSSSAIAAAILPGWWMWRRWKNSPDLFPT